jgi:hypothetical protein
MKIINIRCTHIFGEIQLLLFAFQEGALAYLTESRSGCGTFSYGKLCTVCFLSVPFSRLLLLPSAHHFVTAVGSIVRFPIGLITNLALG